MYFLKYFNFIYIYIYINLKTVKLVVKIGIKFL